MMITNTSSTTPAAAGFGAGLTWHESGQNCNDRLVYIHISTWLTFPAKSVFSTQTGVFIFCRSVTSHDNRVSTRTLLLLLLGRSHTDTKYDKVRDSSVAFAAAATGGRGSRVCRSVGSLIPGMIRV